MTQHQAQGQRQLVQFHKTIAAAELCVLQPRWRRRLFPPAPSYHGAKQFNNNNFRVKVTRRKCNNSRCRKLGDTTRPRFVTKTSLRATRVPVKTGGRNYTASMVEAVDHRVMTDRYASQINPICFGISLLRRFNFNSVETLAVLALVRVKRSDSACSDAESLYTHSSFYLSLSLSLCLSLCTNLFAFEHKQPRTHACTIICIRELGRRIKKSRCEFSPW